MNDLVATAEIDIDAPPARVWAALTSPDEIKQYMFGSVVETDWQPGSRITWTGNYDGKPYEDKGSIVAIEPEHLLVLTHFSPMSGQEDMPANYHTLTYRLEGRDVGSHLSLSQDHNSSEDEAQHSSENWHAMLTQLKNAVEGT
jgi:uncharacterized protein YndB with AHSA1/START domain